MALFGRPQVELIVGGEHVVALADAIGLRGVHGGALVNAAAAEAMTSLLIFINKTYQVDGAGIRITDALKAVA